MCSPNWLTFHNHYVRPYCENTCLPNWFGRFYRKVNDVPEIWKIENFHQISIFHSVGCFVNEIWKIENNYQISIFHSVGCFVKIDQES